EVPPMHYRALFFCLVLTAVALFSLPLIAAPATITVSVNGIAANGVLAPQFAQCIPDPAMHTKTGANISPRVTWSAGPAGTKSYALILHDDDVPQDLAVANKAGASIAATAPRRTLYHWVLVDIPPTVTTIEEGADSQAMSAITRTSHGL